MNIEITYIQTEKEAKLILKSGNKIINIYEAEIVGKNGEDFISEAKAVFNDLPDDIEMIFRGLKGFFNFRKGCKSSNLKKKSKRNNTSAKS